MSDRLTIRFASDMPAATVEVVSPDLQVVDRVMLNAGRSRDVDVPSEQSFLRVHLPSGQVVTLQDPGNLDRKISMAMIRGGSRATGTRGASIAPQVVDPPEETTFDAIRQYHRLRSGLPRNFGRRRRNPAAVVAGHRHPHGSRWIHPERRVVQPRT